VTGFGRFEPQIGIIRGDVLVVVVLAIVVIVMVGMIGVAIVVIGGGVVAVAAMSFSGRARVRALTGGRSLFVSKATVRPVTIAIAISCMRC